MAADETQIDLHLCLSHWGSDAFQASIKAALQQQDASSLPLQQGLSQGSYASEKNLSVVILSVRDDAAHIRVNAGVFYTGIIPGCQCADDPSPNNEVNEYCDIQVVIDKSTGMSRVCLLD